MYLVRNSVFPAIAWEKNGWTDSIWNKFRYIRNHKRNIPTGLSIVTDLCTLHDAPNIDTEELKCKVCIQETPANELATYYTSIT